MKEDQFIPAFSYDFLTPFYDFFVNLLFGYKERAKIVKLLNLKEGELLLDVGCGTGTLLVVAKKLHPTNKMTGIDIDDRILKYAQKKINKENLDIKIIKASAAKLPFDNSSFDVVVSTFTFHHLPTAVKKQSLKEIKRVLRRGGRFLLIDFGRAEGFWMNFLYALEKLFHIKEADTLKDNIEGKLPLLLKQGGFNVKEVAPKYRGIQHLLATTD